MVKTGMISFRVVSPLKITYPGYGDVITGKNVNVYRNFDCSYDDDCVFGYYNLYLDGVEVEDHRQGLENRLYTIDNLVDGNHEFEVVAYYNVNNVEFTSTDSVVFSKISEEVCDESIRIITPGWDNRNYGPH